MSWWATLDGADLKYHFSCFRLSRFQKTFPSTFVLHIPVKSHERSIALHPLNVRKPTRFSFFRLHLDHLITSVRIINNNEFGCSQCFALAGCFEILMRSIFRFSRLLFRQPCLMSIVVFCVLSALSNGSFGMQLGNLLSVFHIMWHVYDPNKFKDVNFFSRWPSKNLSSQ